ncbi:vacuolar protein sorting-associated protein 13A-like [Oreochromis aureus]|uniref:vacuolar protein sorting-associated protein 13A-like n=1 Tax=Oreochromis aureus TaxID=47969 RepID=UPI001952AD47|nr:vacuolar protein sorting-associated protein 13A-like [Oreochromis aureus]
MKSTIISPPPGRFVKEDLFLHRQKWTKEHRNAKINDVLLLKDGRNQWKLARIIEVYPGKDGRVRKAIKQMYVLALGLDVLGNQFGLIRGLSEGVEAFFYEPYQGAIQGPEEFVEGMTLGVKALVGGAYRSPLVCRLYLNGKLPQQSHNMFQSRYREANLQILIHCFCCGSSSFLYFHIQFLTDSDIFLNVVVWSDIFLVSFFFQKIENGRFASYRYFAHAKVNESDFLMITKRGIFFVTKGTFGQLTCEWQYLFEEFTKDPTIIEDRRLRIEAKERVKSVFHAKEFGKIINFKTPEIAKWVLAKLEDARESLPKY